jgi:hypothetical protein
MTGKTVQHPHRDTQYAPKFLPAGCENLYLVNSSFRMWWRISGTWRDATRRVGQQFYSFSFVRAYFRRCHQPVLSYSSICSKHSHMDPAWYSDAKRYRLWRHKTLFPGGPLTWPDVIRSGDIATLAVGFVLVGRRRRTSSAVVLAIMNVSKINDWNTV